MKPNIPIKQISRISTQLPSKESSSKIHSNALSKILCKTPSKTPSKLPSKPSTKNGCKISSYNELIKQVYETAKKEGMLIRQKQITNDPIFQRSSNYLPKKPKSNALLQQYTKLCAPKPEKHRKNLSKQSHIFNSEEDVKNELSKTQMKYAKKRELVDEYLKRNHKDKVSSVKMVQYQSYQNSMQNLLTDPIQLNKSVDNVKSYPTANVSQENSPRQSKMTMSNSNANFYKPQGIKTYNNLRGKSQNTKDRLFSHGDLDRFTKERQKIMHNGLKYKKAKKDHISAIIDYQIKPDKHVITDKPNNIPYSQAVKNLKRNAYSMKNDVFL